jgi:hypothetical protein
MSDERSTQDDMNYESMAHEALRGVILTALRRAASPEGLPAEHQLFITFKTRAASVSVPQDLLYRYPDEMTIVLQHQFWDLVVGESFFAVTLHFDRQPKRLSVPYAAITRFYDPSVQFLLQWPAPPVQDAEIIPGPVASPRHEGPSSTDVEKSGENADTPKIVSLDQFRKK